MLPVSHLSFKCERKVKIFSCSAEIWFQIHYYNITLHHIRICDQHMTEIDTIRKSTSVSESFFQWRVSIWCERDKGLAPPHTPPSGARPSLWQPWADQARKSKKKNTHTHNGFALPLIDYSPEIDMADTLPHWAESVNTVTEVRVVEET